MIDAKKCDLTQELRLRCFTFTGGSMNNTGTVIVNADELSVTDEYFNGLFTKGTGSTQGKLNFSGNAINVDGEVDLNGLGIINSSNGSLDSNRLGLKAEGATLTTDTVSLKGFYTADELDLDVVTLKVEGTAQGGSSHQKIRFEMASGTTITVHDALNGSNEIEQFVIKATDAGDTTSLILDAGANGGKITNIQNFHVGWDNSGSSVFTVKGTWDFGGSVIKAGSSGTVTIDGTANNVGELRLQQGGKTTINGAMEIDRLLGSEADGGTLNINGTLSVTGDGTTETKNSDDEYRNDVYLTEATVNINNGGTFAITTADAVEDVIKVTTDTSTGEITAIEVPQSGSNTAEQGGWLTQAQLTSLKSSLVASGSQGSFDFGDGLTIQLDKALQEAIDSGEVSYSQLSSGGVNDVQGVAEGVTVTVTSQEASTGINLSNGAAAVELQSGTTSLAVNGTLALNGTGGNFVYAENTPDAPVAVSVKANSGVNLTGAGTVGSLTKDSNVTGTSAVLTAGQGATQTVQGTIDLAEVTIGTGTVNVTQSVTADELTVNGNLTVSGGAGAVAIGDSGATIAGSLQAGAFTSSGDVSVTGAVLADSIVLGTNKNLTVGDASNSGLVEVETLNLNGGMLLIDPDWTQNASFVAVTSGVNSPDVIDVGGSIGVGRNSVGVFGATNTEAQDALNRLGLLQAGKLDEHGIGSVLYLGQSLAVGNQNDVLVDKTLDNAGLSSAIGSMTTNSGSVTLNNGSALVVSESFSNDLVNDPSQAIFEFAATAGSTVTVTAESGTKIIFDSAIKLRSPLLVACSLVPLMILMTPSPSA